MPTQNNPPPTIITKISLIIKVYNNYPHLRVKFHTLRGVLHLFWERCLKNVVCTRQAIFWNKIETPKIKTIWGLLLDQNNFATLPHEYRSLLFFIYFPDREDVLKRSYEEQMKALKYELETMKSDYQTKIVEFTERSNQHDASSTMLKSLKEKHEKELELLKEVRDLKRFLKK